MNIAIAGHSQVPEDFSYYNAVIRVFKKPGALASRFFDYPELTGVLNYQYDLVILWIGSNDITPGCGARYLPERICYIAGEIQRWTGADIRIILVEPRDCPPGNRNCITLAEYKRIAKAVNKKIIQRCRYRNTWGTISTFGFPAFHLATDGVHFDRRAREVIEERIHGSIRRWRRGRV